MLPVCSSWLPKNSDARASVTTPNLDQMYSAPGSMRSAICGKKYLSTQSLVSPSYFGRSIIFCKGNFPKLNPD